MFRTIKSIRIKDDEKGTLYNTPQEAEKDIHEAFIKDNNVADITPIRVVPVVHSIASDGIAGYYIEIDIQRSAMISMYDPYQGKKKGITREKIEERTRKNLEDRVNKKANLIQNDNKEE